MPDIQPKPFTPDQLGERWGCSGETVRQLVKRGELRGFRIGRMIRIPQKEVEEFECQTSILEDCAAACASTGRGRTESECVVNLRHAPERKQNPRR
ncbi:helix-turn-helix domain-containing protein [Tritonibacter mobilis]|uniref:helix-turn-helix domain-containing protein n=1 Tax=Tritonibacter mobilis TaxID=379347 RepID=UPI000D764F81